MFHSDEDKLRTGDQIHPSTHTFQHFAWNGPVGESSPLVYLKRAKNGEIHVAAANHGERISRRKINAAGDFGDCLFAGVNEVGIDLGLERIRTDAKHAVFRLKDYVHAPRNMIGDERGHADAEIDVKAVTKLTCDAAGDAFAFLIVGKRHGEFSVFS